MRNNSLGDSVRLQHIKIAIELIFEFINNVDKDEFCRSLLIQSAVVKQFEVIGEAANNFSEDFLTRYSQIEWKPIIAFRHLLIHEYFKVLPDRVWETIHVKLPELKIQIDEIIKTL